VVPETEPTLGRPRTIEKLKAMAPAVAGWAVVAGAAGFGFGAGREWFLDWSHGGDKSTILCTQGDRTVYQARGHSLTAAQVGPEAWIVNDPDGHRTVQVQGRCVYSARQHDSER
jgi:hypothetical protein